MNIRTSIIALLLSSILFISACIKIDDPEMPDTGTASLSAKINGETFSVSGVFVSAEYTAQNQMVQSIAVAGAESPINGVNRAIALAMVAVDSTQIQSGDTFVATSTSRVGAGEYTFDNGTTDIKAVSSNTDKATLTITNINYDTKLVSGTFSFEGSDDDDPGTTYQITDGVFTDVPFN
jgi:hypothetical protein